MRPGRASRALVLALLASGPLAPGAGARATAQAPPAAVPSSDIPQVPAGRVEQVTVDVVVLDRKGQPVTGLGRDAFTVLEEGQPQTVVSFDVVDRTPGIGVASAPSAPPRVTTNVGTKEDEEIGRTFIVLFDDLNLTFTAASAAKRAVAAFLDRGAVEGDRVTLFTTSGTAWWSTRMMGGRDDLLAILKRLDGRRILETASERITDYEAFQIVHYRDVMVAARVQDRLERYGTKLIQSPDREHYQNARELFQRGVVDPYVENLALQTYLTAKFRMEESLQTIERAIRALGEERSRKALLLVSEGFVEDPSREGPRRVIEAARRANATIYFVDPSGLRGLDPMYSAEFGPALDSRDTMTAIADLSREGEGAAILAERTGGFSIRDTNAFDEGAVRIGRESQSYYLIGYNPGDIPRDGRFRKIEVKVRGGHTVRARRGYYAPAPEGAAPEAPRRDVDPVLQQALDAPRASDDIPLRVTAYVMEDAGFNRTRVVLAADADVAGVEFADVLGQPQAILDTLAVIAHRDTAEALRSDQKVVIQRRAGPARSGPMWYSFLREFTVAPGEHQAKLVVRDPLSGRVGTVIHRFSVPAHDQFRVSTPVLTDTLADPGTGPTPVFLTRREFPQSALLYCRFDVFGAAKDPGAARPRVRAGHALRQGAQVIGRAAPSLIEPTSLGALARMVQIPLRGFAPGAYELVLNVTDEVSGATREIVEPFTITPPVTASR